MASNLMTKPIDWSKYGVIYAGASKNIGPAGVTVCIVRSDLVANHRRDTPLLCDWELFAKAPNTFHNTPSCFPIYMCGLNLAYMKEQGGIAAMQAAAEERARRVYELIDNSNGYYVSVIEKKYRSRITIPFRIPDSEELEAKFVRDSDAEGLVELQGHPTVGHLRACLYNAMPMDGCDVLIEFMNRFKNENPRSQN